MAAAPKNDDAADLMAAFTAVVRANASLVSQLSARAGVHENALRALVLISDTGYLDADRGRRVPGARPRAR